MRKRFFSILLLLALLQACIPAPAAKPANWWNEAVFYEIFVRSFYDTNGDGIGDFNGITEKLDYLETLGITAIWLMPIHPSPSYHGYDVTDYYAVNPEYGTMEDFKNLLAEAHRRDIRIILDLVLNHTSSKHPWFEEASRDRNSKYYDYYVWSETGEGDGGWHRGAHGYYFGLFWEGMPDLNFNNPEVTADMLKVTDFWLTEVGVDGFRVDAAKHLIEEDGKRENTKATHDWFKGFYTAYKEMNPQAYTIGEVYGAGSSVIKSYTGDQLDHVFNFEMSSGIVNSVNGGANSGINSAFKFAFQDMPDFNYATFLTNHDQNRVMSVFNGNTDKAKVAAALLLTSPGTPYIYFGEEIGMVGKKPDEDIRVPMQWSDEENAGFTTGTPWRAVNSDYKDVNVAAQLEDPASLLNHYRNLIQLRKGHPALQNGDAALVETGNSAVFSLLRRSGREIILILVNLKNEPISEYRLSLKGGDLPNGKLTPSALFGAAQPQPLQIANGQFVDYKPVNELLPYDVHILKLR